MVAVKFLKDPGYIYDLNFIFYLNFNFKSFIETLPDDAQKDSRIEFFDSIREDFGEVPEDLYVFYHMIENGRTFVTTSYIVPRCCSIPTELNFKSFLEQFQDTDALIRNMIQFYLYDLTPEEVELCATSHAELVSRIKATNYTDDEKSNLYEFFADPIPYIQTLRAQLTEKDVLLSAYYEKNSHKILNSFQQVSFETLSEQVKDFENLDFMKDGDQTLSISHCLLNKFCVFSFAAQESMLYLLGCDYASVLDFIIELRKEPSLVEFGNALSEDNRAQMLKYLLTKEECTCKDFEKVFSFSGSTVYHHISFLLRYGVVKNRNIGKTVLYSINRPYIDNVIKALQKFSTKGE